MNNAYAHLSPFDVVLWICWTKCSGKMEKRNASLREFIKKVPLSSNSTTRMVDALEEDRFSASLAVHKKNIVSHVFFFGYK